MSDNTDKKYIIDNQQLMSEWDYEKNAGVDPAILSTGSNKKVWWICSKCGYNWQAKIYNRAVKGSGCTHCYHSKRKNFIFHDNLAITHPDIALDWHPTKNGKLMPSDFTKDSNYIAWWKCHICGEEKEKEIKFYKGCRKCKRKILLENNNLELTHKELLKEWNYEKNTDVTPRDFPFGSNKAVWWKCSVCGYEWKARIANRAILGRGCPCCANKTVVSGINDLASTHPNIAKEWHPTKNGLLTPQKVSHGTGKKVWWLCPNGHEYQATVLHRTQSNGTDCPICNSGRQTSFAEQAFYFYIKKLYPDAVSRYTAEFLERMELDIYIPSIKFAIEYDGEAWHKKEKLAREQRKYQKCKEHGIKLIRIREKMAEPCSDIADMQFSAPDLYKHNNLEPMIKEIIRRIDFVTGNWLHKCSIDVNIERDRFEIQKYRQKLKTDSLVEKYPDLAKEWHPSKNGNLMPDMFKPGSQHKVWWLCPVCGKEYEARIYSRASQHHTGCPVCGKEKSAISHGKKVNMINIETRETIRTFNTISEAGRALKINSSNITSVCRGIRAKAGGYAWEYAE